ncbi:hypothetical protein GV794_27500 [Nocardia cyriacigeorgica]|uniref:Uncharacterized protein n=1 Tax=Nocardia cyriacigeorgica TaxID=135487 RepID=A0A6P1D7G2_9NOCA|nr:hypothetical protein [Nocardia cyriacigeorgica]NEW41991.1 hypothetical protein [Nocardia cyriacigeorgica]NEW44773.1 hypothetical protein [Nocardia cyriacigeorgica]NEW59348.1 hypothetical protein [Nocardia cyriacigeorgica]
MALFASGQQQVEFVGITRAQRFDARPGLFGVVILPAPEHLGPLELNRVMEVADVEVVLPRLSFARWSTVEAGR